MFNLQTRRSGIVHATDHYSPVKQTGIPGCKEHATYCGRYIWHGTRRTKNQPVTCKACQRAWALRHTKTPLPE